MPWGSWLNAEIYDRFVREHEIYDWLNRRLVDFSRVAEVGRILDLACGTGATTLACLRAMDPRAEIVGIDASEPMIRVARTNVLDPRARFEVLPAAEADRLGGEFDRVVCCAAFWQFPFLGPVFRALARCTRPGALLVFNVPAERVRGESTPIHPFQTALLEEIEVETGRRFEARPAVVDPAQLESQAAEHGFARAALERCVYRGRQHELIELMTIPAMIGPLTEGLRQDRREAVLERVRRHADPDLEVIVPWVYFIFERRQGR